MTLFKVFTFTFKFLAKPVITRTKQYTKENHGGISNGLQKFFIWMGNTIYIQESRMTRRLMDLQGDDELFRKKLSNTEALELGIDYFYETLLYTLLFGISFYEIMKNSKKEEVIADRILRMDDAFNKRKLILKDADGSESQKNGKNGKEEPMELLVFFQDSIEKMTMAGNQIEKIREKTKKIQERLIQEAKEIEKAAKETGDFSLQKRKLEEEIGFAMDISHKISEIMSQSLDKV